jgi:hypothetical protein
MLSGDEATGGAEDVTDGFEDSVHPGDGMHIIKRGSECSTA